MTRSISSSKRTRADCLPGDKDFSWEQLASKLRVMEVSEIVREMMNGEPMAGGGGP